MGLSIYYKGRFKQGASLTDMIDEVKDIAEVNKWEYHIFETEFDQSLLERESSDQNIFGITYSPPSCEPICLTFLSNGRMCNPFILELCKDSKEKERYSYGIFSKTQYAGFEAHKIIIDLFRYLSKKYFSEFELTDESNYWESGDEALMRQTFKKYNDMMDIFAGELENIPFKKNENIVDFVERVAKILKFK